MECARANERLEEYLADCLDAADAEAVSSHLADCSACAEALEQAQRLETLISMVRLAEPPEAFFGRQRSSILARLGPEVEWEAPRLSLLFLAFILAGYVAGAMAPLMASVNALSAGVSTLAATLDGVGLLYGLLLLLAFNVVAREPAPVLAEVRR